MSGESGHAAVREFLERAGVAYEVVEHKRTETATAEARAAGLPAADVAKTVVLREQNAVRLAVIPACERLDMKKVKRELGSQAVRLVTESEMASEFDEFEVGAVPPFGPMFQALELVDRRLLDHERILCGGGDHQHGVLVDPNDVVRASQARAVDICED
jgi:Ala-tRNA(Pro) deacylase